MADQNSVENSVPGLNGGSLLPGGKPGNKGGTGRPPSEFRDACLGYSQEALETLLGVMRTGRDGDKVKAAQLILERAYGKANQPITGADGGPIEVMTIDEIRRKIGL